MKADRRPTIAISEPVRAARRRFLETALLAGLALPLVESALADEASAADNRPQEGDRFVFAEGEREGSEVKPGDLPLGGPQVFAWPKDPRSGVVRDGSRLNQVLLLRLDPATLDDETRAHAADGIVAYSAICTHAQCPVTGWVDDGGKHMLKCFCHDSEYDPRAGATVVFGPAPRHLAVLPLRVIEGGFVAGGTFLGRVGLRPS
jgi:nitrite reductase/ring-hydroxylating ferredoxin subunit